MTTRKPKKQTTIKQLDSMWSHVIREIYGGKCALCGKDGQAAHHFFPKGSHSATRWDVHNGVMLCFGCHIRKVHQGGDTEPARDALIRRIGKSKFADLKEKASRIYRMKERDYVDIREQLKAYLEPDYIEALRGEGK